MQDRIVNILPIYKTNYTEADCLTFANISDEYAAFLGNDLALDYVDPEFVDPPINNTNLPEFFNSTDPHNFTSVPDADFINIFGENLYPHNLATQIKKFELLFRILAPYPTALLKNPFLALNVSCSLPLQPSLVYLAPFSDYIIHLKFIKFSLIF
jgi:hypothetical protein